MTMFQRKIGYLDRLDEADGYIGIQDSSPSLKSHCLL